MRALATFLFAVTLGCSGSMDGDEAQTPPTETASLDTASTETDPIEDSAVVTEDSASDDVAADTAPPPVVDAGPSSSRQTARPLGSSDSPRGYYEYLPPGYSATGSKSPLLLFFHGIDENGNGTTELSRVLRAGPPMLIAKDKWPASRPFIVLSSQNASGCPSPAGVKAFLDWSIAHYNVDPARIYLTGLSCGAIGTWDYLRVNVKTTPVAAALVIAGNGRSAWDTNKCDLGRVAIWGLHGDADMRVTPDGTTYPMNNLIACPKPPRRDAKLTIYPDVGHDSWSRTYDLSAGHDVYAWLLANHL